jgi:Arylsulfatase A and related enzymes
MFDIDTLRPDHLGCYGYGRNTSPAIDEVAREGVRFDRYFCPNAPCLPSRASLVTGQYGIRNGVVGHGGTAADLRLEGRERGFRDDISMHGLFMQFRRAGMHTVSFSTFAERHSAWWFNSGFNECHNVGGGGMESAEEVTPLVLDWLDRRGTDDNWFMHIHFWDPHTPYRAPADFGNPYAETPLSDNWITEELFAEHLRHVGPHGPREIAMWNDNTDPRYPRHPGKLDSLADVKNFIDQYDCGVRFADNNVGLIINRMRELGIYNDDTAVIITSDHGENLGEGGIYGEHGTVDEATSRIPLIIKWPGCAKNTCTNHFYDNTDMIPTIRGLLELKNPVPKNQYDGISFLSELRGGGEVKRDHAVLTQCAHVCQRGVCFENYIYIRTLHGGYHLLDREQLYDLSVDPHQTKNIASMYPELCAKGARLILEWTDTLLFKSQYPVDPMQTVLHEGGPLHCRGAFDGYVKRLRDAGRAADAELLLERYPNK